MIVIDSREKAKAITKIISQFKAQKISYISSKLYVGDYMNFDNPRLIVDRKQNLTELCGNVCQDHERFRNELIRAQEAGIKLIILVEHGRAIKTLEDIVWWVNPREVQRIKKDGVWHTEYTNTMKGETLYKVLKTMSQKYGCEFQFCNKEETGKRIIEILGENNDK